jgi:protein TonB
VLAELERAELELAEPQLASSGPEKAALDQSAAESFAPVFSAYQQRPKKTRGSLVALLMLALAGAGFYAAWTYQPGFRAIAQPQVDRVLALAAKALPPTSAPSPAKPLAQLAPARTAGPVSPSPTVPNRTQSTAPNPAISSATEAATTSAAATSANAELPGEKSAIILSSKGAERRLAHSVPAPYPSEAPLGGAEGTVVLKVVVDETGKVDGLRLVEGNATLATAAMQSVKQWRYRPYVRDGKAQPFQTVVIVDFQRP